MILTRQTLSIPSTKLIFHVLPHKAFGNTLLMAPFTGCKIPCKLLKYSRRTINGLIGLGVPVAMSHWSDSCNVGIRILQTWMKGSHLLYKSVIVVLMSCMSARSNELSFVCREKMSDVMLITLKGNARHSWTGIYNWSVVAHEANTRPKNFQQYILKVDGR